LGPLVLDALKGLLWGLLRLLAALLKRWRLTMRDAPAAVAPGPKPLYLDENVQFTVYRPTRVQPAKWYSLLAFAHLAEAPSSDDLDPVQQVQQIARQALGEDAKTYAELRQDSAAPVPRDGELTFLPEVAGVEFDPPRRSFLWQESVHREDFQLRASAELSGRIARGRLSVFLGSIVLAEVPIVLEVGSPQPEADAQSELVPQASRPYRKIFASYSRQDSAIVDEFARYAHALGDEYLRDVVSVRSGELWNDRIMELIGGADVFQLFWSWNAMRSPYVRSEWEYALTLNKPYFIRPLYWEEPMPRSEPENLPPEALARINFTRIPKSASESSTGPFPSGPKGGDVTIAGDIAKGRVRPSGPRRRRAVPLVIVVVLVLLLTLAVATFPALAPPPFR